MILEKVARNFSKGGFDSKISSVILDEIQEKGFFTLTVTELAERTGTSQPTISRYVKSELGAKTYKEMTRIVNIEANQYFKNIHNNSIDGNSNQIIEDITKTITSLSFDSIEKIARMILKAQKINTVAIGGNYSVKLEIEHKLSQIGKNVMVTTDWHHQLMNIEYMSKGDVCIIISYSGDKKEIKKILEKAIEKNIDVIAITGDFDSVLANKATETMKIKSLDNQFRVSSFTSRICAIAAFEVVYKELIRNKEISEKLNELWKFQTY